jgi:hypothetical protein
LLAGSAAGCYVAGEEILGAAGLAVGIAAAILLRGGKAGGNGGSPASAGAPAARAAPSTPATGSDLAKLRGRWLRPDGGYILEIREVAAGGTIDAVYLNPRPIHVARAEATTTPGSPRAST